MSWFVLLALIVGVYLLIKVTGFLLKLAVVALLLLGIYWLISSHLGWPLPPENLLSLSS